MEYKNGIYLQIFSVLVINLSDLYAPDDHICFPFTGSRDSSYRLRHPVARHSVKPTQTLVPNRGRNISRKTSHLATLLALNSVLDNRTVISSGKKEKTVVPGGNN